MAEQSAWSEQTITVHEQTAQRVYLGICIAVTGLFGMGDPRTEWISASTVRVFTCTAGGSYYGSFSAATIGRWSAPEGEGSYSGGSSYSRSSGGSWGGGK